MSRPKRQNFRGSRRAFSTRHDCGKIRRFGRLDFIVMIEGSVWQGSAAVAALCQRHVEREGVVMIEELKTCFLDAIRPRDRTLRTVLPRHATRRVDLAQQRGKCVEQASNLLPHNARC